MTKKIFISYRSTDSYDTRQLAEFLRNEFGHNNIFFDKASMKPGVHWPDSIKQSLMHSDIMLLIIGPKWLHYQDEQSGRRRIDMQTDWVRREILTFLKRKEKNAELLLIPVLVDEAEPLVEDQLDHLLAPVINFEAIKLFNNESSLNFVEIKKVLLDSGMVSIYPDRIDTPISTPLPDRLTKKQEDEFIENYPGWKSVTSPVPDDKGNYSRELYRFFDFKTYEEAWKFMSRIDKKAIRPCNHHPRWQNTYLRVEFWLCTFNVGHSPSQRDLRLAEIIEEVWEEFK